MAARRRRCGAFAAAALAAIVLAVPSPSGAATDGGSPGASASIIGGKPASIAAFPWLAFVQFDNGHGNGFACTGTVVSPRLVLTAGHCVQNLESGGLYPADGYTVVTGVTNISEATTANKSAVSRVLVNPGFKPSKLHGDAGLLQLAAPVSAPPLALATTADGPALTAGTQALIAGWGLIRPTARSGPDTLYAGEGTISSTSRCAKDSELFYIYFEASTQFCLIQNQAGPSRTCHGDSGGPAIARRADGSLVEVGITSLGEEECRPLFPGIFTRVDKISGWVNQWIAALEAGGPAPKVVVPEVHPPFLPSYVAKSLAYEALREAFGNRFSKGRQKRLACRHVARERVNCGVSWWQGPNDYYGTITIYLTVRRSEVVWAEHFRIHWVNDRCWFESGNRRSCRIHTLTR